MIKKILFLLLFVLISLPMYSSSYNIEIPYSFNEVSDVGSPSNWIKEEQIKVYSDRIVISLENAEWARFTDTNSMDPVIDSESNAIEIVPKNYSYLSSGDIISYSVDMIEGTIIHRIVEIGFDSLGWYAITKGDNLENVDPFKVRFEDVKRVVVAVVY
tara:strand:- start:1680 stop:2153 length:474 start_codon:yes stop_codon:yes gene_type:complete